MKNFMEKKKKFFTVSQSRSRSFASSPHVVYNCNLGSCIKVKFSLNRRRKSFEAKMNHLFLNLLPLSIGGVQNEALLVVPRV